MNQQQSQQPTKMSSITAWIILIVIIIILGVGAYFFLNQEEETNTNINITKNTNSVVNRNVNSVANINTAVNTNTVSNTNTIADTTNWQTYENEEWGFSIKHPFDWTDSIYGQMINISPENVEYGYEGGVAYPIYFTKSAKSLNERLTGIDNTKITNVKINSIDAVLVDGYFNTEYYIIDTPNSGGSLSISNHIEELRVAGNYDENLSLEYNKVLDEMLNSFNLD